MLGTTMRSVRFSKTFDEDSFGARRAHVEEAIRSPDGYADTHELEEEPGRCIVLHTRAVPNRTSPEFVWIVLSIIERGIQTVLFGFRAYTGEVSISDPSDAMAVLQAFANHFGLEADWATGERKRFIEHARFSREDAQRFVNIGKERKFLSITLLKALPSGEADLRWGFFLDTDKYQEALRRRQVATDDDPVTFDVAPLMRGRFAHSDLLRAEGSCWALLEVATVGLLWCITCGPFKFAAQVSGHGVHLERYGGRASVSRAASNAKHIFVAFSWSPTVLKVYAAATLRVEGSDPSELVKSGKVSAETNTPFTLPPNRMIRWARGRILDPATTYADEQEFRGAVLDVLSSLQEVLYATGSQTSLWDVERDGNRVSGHRPKRETDCQAWVRGQLFNLASTKNFEISYEPTIGAGSLDALITGVTEGGRLVRACVEFKLAHSKDLEHGVDVQLPEYMRQKACDFGIYFVFDFRCELFDDPGIPDLSSHLKLRPARTAEPIHVIVLRCGYQVPPSKMKDPFADA
jgi:hypothetical protein